MAYTITVSCDKETHEKYQRFCKDNLTNVSKEFQLFMESELKGKENIIKTLQNNNSLTNKKIDEIIDKLDLNVEKLSGGVF